MIAFFANYRHMVHTYDHDKAFMEKYEFLMKIPREEISHSKFIYSKQKKRERIQSQRIGWLSKIDIDYIIPFNAICFAHSLNLICL
jgi:hypothetical protein